MEFLTTFGMALMPVAVMEDCIAAGMDLNMPVVMCYAAAVLGSICPVPFLLAVVADPATSGAAGGCATERTDHEASGRSAMESAACGAFGRSAKTKAERRGAGGSIMGRYGEAVVFLFAAMPFLAGATWIGAVLSAFLHINAKKALLLLFLGSFVSGGIALIMLR